MNEIIHYDLPATIKHIQDETEKSLFITSLS